MLSRGKLNVAVDVFAEFPFPKFHSQLVAPEERLLKVTDELSQEKDSEFSLDETNELHQTALHVAAVNGQLALVKILLKQGAKPNLSDSDMRTPLHEAAAAGWSAI